MAKEKLISLDRLDEVKKGDLIEICFRGNKSIAGYFQSYFGGNLVLGSSYNLKRPTPEFDIEPADFKSLALGYRVLRKAK